MSSPPENSFKGGSHVSRAHERPPFYDDRCARHITLAEPGPCGDCADVRKANQQRRALTVVRETRHCLVHAETYTTTCRGCRADEIASEEETA